MKYFSTEKMNEMYASLFNQKKTLGWDGHSCSYKLKGEVNVWREESVSNSEVKSWEDFILKKSNEDPLYN